MSQAKFQVRLLTEEETQKLAEMVASGDDLAREALDRYKELAEKLLKEPTKKNAQELEFLLENQLRVLILLG